MQSFIAIAHSYIKSYMGGGGESAAIRIEKLYI